MSASVVVGVVGMAARPPRTAEWEGRQARRRISGEVQSDVSWQHWQVGKQAGAKPTGQPVAMQSVSELG
jgi:hypothetical protein